MLCELSYDIIADEENIFKEFNGLLTEQFVLQELSNISKINTIYYWSNDSQAEVDFVFGYKALIIPVEAKAYVNVKAKSLRVYINEYSPRFALRFSLQNMSKESDILNIPLYLMWNTNLYLEENV